MSDYSSDNSGNKIPADVNACDPVLGSGQVITAGSKNTNAEITVESGKMYAITSLLGAHYFGIADTATATNAIWACGAGHTIVVRIPIGYTVLHYQTPSDTRKLILRELAD